MTDSNNNGDGNNGAPSTGKPHYVRLSDKILDALTLSLEQKDVVISDLLSRSLEMAMTRNAGGAGFTERRDLSDDVERALKKLEILKNEAKGR